MHILKISQPRARSQHIQVKFRKYRPQYSYEVYSCKKKKTFPKQQWIADMLRILCAG